MVVIKGQRAKNTMNDSPVVVVVNVVASAVAIVILVTVVVVVYNADGVIVNIVIVSLFPCHCCCYF